jgi:hypothetical protein
MPPWTILPSARSPTPASRSGSTVLEHARADAVLDVLRLRLSSTTD